MIEWTENAWNNLGQSILRYVLSYVYSKQPIGTEKKYRDGEKI